MKAWKRTWTEFGTGEVKSIEISPLCLEEKSISNCRVEEGVFLTDNELEQVVSRAVELALSGKPIGNNKIFCGEDAPFIQLNKSPGAGLVGFKFRCNTTAEILEIIKAELEPPL